MKTLDLEDIKNAQKNGTVVALLGRIVGKQMTAQIFHEMIEYKTIEEDLGVGLITLFMALANGAYFRDPYHRDRIIYFKDLEFLIDFKKKRFDIRMDHFVKYYEYRTGGAFFLFKDYGKTWALTREELE